MLHYQSRAYRTGAARAIDVRTGYFDTRYGFLLTRNSGMIATEILESKQYGKKLSDAQKNAIKNSRNHKRRSKKERHSTNILGKRLNCKSKKLISRTVCKAQILCKPAGKWLYCTCSKIMRVVYQSDTKHL
eukprot:IDg16240t1